MNTEQGFPQITSPLTDSRTGRLQQAWFQLLIALWNRTGKGVGVDTLELQSIVNNLIVATTLQSDNAAIEASAENVEAVAMALAIILSRGPQETPDAIPYVDRPVEAPEAVPVTLPPLGSADPAPPVLTPPGVVADTMPPMPPIPDSAPASPGAIAVGASPFSYRPGYNGTVVVNGGTVSVIEFSRDGATWINWPLGSVVTVCTSDYVRVTYAAPPTMTFIGT